MVKKLSLTFPKLPKLKLRKRFWLFGGLFIITLVASWGLAQLLRTTPQGPVISAVGEVAVAGEPIQPIPLTLDLDERKVTLGDKLFHDAQLSSNGTVSCATCHVPKEAFAQRGSFLFK